jgi:tRNA A37 threonylcarbamoyladenosine dehydratase
MDKGEPPGKLEEIKKELEIICESFSNEKRNNSLTKIANQRLINSINYAINAIDDIEKEIKILKYVKSHDRRKPLQDSRY